MANTPANDVSVLREKDVNPATVACAQHSCTQVTSHSHQHHVINIKAFNLHGFLAVQSVAVCQQTTAGDTC